MVVQENQNHFLLVTFPAQGHINPALQFAKRLTNTGAHVTFVTSVHGQKRMSNSSTSSLDGITFAPFSDGYDDGFKSTDGGNEDDEVDHYMSEIRRCGKDTLVAHAKGHRPITCLVYTLLLPWAAEVAREYQLQSALLWIQPATVFDIYYWL
ncbi:Udp-glycosyltransferase 75c1 [Thalictrum thalictroides]|uniref:Udp-glycosyltransferase 75c1 n=1 Tax=Thalictrum thalictroides TaxID=46969 RepID=A0A7J6UXF0_THATH|nr:Udp-glycosyltransferase 75c1 [Thalictrum thalictroides]